MAMIDRLHWAGADAWTVTRRDLLHWARQPAGFAIGLLFPVMTVLMFGYLFGGGMTVPGGGSYREFLLPGMYAMTMVFGMETTFAAVSADAAKGVTDRFRSMPMAPSAVVVGRGTADLLNSALGLAVMVACGLLVGWQWRRGAGSALAAVGLLLLLRFGLLWVGVYLGLVSRSPETLVAVQILVWPLGFLSNVRRAGHHAGVARRDRRLEPFVGNGYRDPGAVRQPGRRWWLLGHGARAADGDRLAGTAGGGVPSAVGSALPVA